MLHNLPSLPRAWILSLSFTLAGRYALVILHLHKQECYYNMMECCVLLLYLWDAVIRRKSKLVIRRLMFIVRLPCLETFDKQRVAKAGKKRCCRILWELAKIIPHSAQLPCENASPRWLIFHRQNERFAVWTQWWITPKHIPYGKSGWCRREGEASSSDKLPSLPVSPCSFLLSVLLLLLLLEEEGWGGFYFVRWRLFRLLRDIWKSPQVVEFLDRRPAEQEFPWETKQRNKKNLSDDDLPHQLCRYLLEAENKQQWAGGQTSCPVGWLDGFQFESPGCF